MWKLGAFFVVLYEQSGWVAFDGELEGRGIMLAYDFHDDVLFVLWIFLLLMSCFIALLLCCVFKDHNTYEYCDCLLVQICCFV